MRTCRYAHARPLPPHARLVSSPPARPAPAGPVPVSPHRPSSPVSLSPVPWFLGPVPLRGGSVPRPPSDDPVCPPSGHQQTSAGFRPGMTLSPRGYSAHPSLRLILVFSIGSAKCFSTLLKESNK